MADLKIFAFENLEAATERALSQIQGPETQITKYWKRNLAYLDKYVAKHYPNLYSSYILLFGERISTAAVKQ